MGDSQNLPSQDAALGVWVFQAVFITFFCARSRVPSNAFSDLKCLSPVPIPALPPSLKPRGDQTPQTHIPTPWGGRCPMCPPCVPHVPHSDSAFPPSPTIGTSVFSLPHGDAPRFLTGPGGPSAPVGGPYPSQHKAGPVPPPHMGNKGPLWGWGGGMVLPRRLVPEGRGAGRSWVPGSPPLKHAGCPAVGGCPGGCTAGESPGEVRSPGGCWGTGGSLWALWGGGIPGGFPCGQGNHRKPLWGISGGP